MIKKTLRILLILAFVFVAGCQAQTSTNSNQTQPDQAETSAQPALYDLSEIVKHNSKEDCWLLIEGKVYNLSAYVASHPGGVAILQGCGKDSTELFNTRPMGSGTPHSDRARQGLKQYLIGELKK